MKLVGTFIAPMVAAAINRSLQLDNNYKALLQPLVGKRLHVKLRDMPLTLTFQATATQIHVFANGDDTADIKLTGRIVNLMRLGLSPDPQSLLNASLVEVEGDMLVLQSFQQVMQQMDIDWQGKLANIIGPDLAQAIIKPAHQTKDWIKQSCQSTQQDVTEYLQEEKRMLPSAEAVEDFYDDIAELRSAIDRLEAKLQLQASV